MYGVEALTVMERPHIKFGEQSLNEALIWGGAYGGRF